MSKLNPDELVVTSFETDAASAGRIQPITIETSNDPTAATWCYICPAYSEGCW
jgi:hypothetical protein